VGIIVNAHSDMSGGLVMLDIAEIAEEGWQPVARIRHIGILSIVDPVAIAGGNLRPIWVRYGISTLVQ
jgi:hypothetical protein